MLPPVHQPILLATVSYSALLPVDAPTGKAIEYVVVRAPLGRYRALQLPALAAVTHNAV